MNNPEFLNGKLLISQPKVVVGPFARSVILLANHNITGAWGVIVNHPANSVKMSSIMSAVGIKSKNEELIYIGGPVEPTRVHVIHTLDWFSSTTLRITEEIGITGDLSVLAAISAGQGPALFRTGVGLSAWTAGQLEGEQSGEDPWTTDHRWLITPATIDLCLTGTGDAQWQRAIDRCVNERVSTLF